MPTAKTLKHRLNIIAKLLRENIWKTPKGFYKYSDLGQLVKAKQESSNEEYKAMKLKECGTRYQPEPRLVAKKTKDLVSGNAKKHEELREKKKELSKLSSKILSEQSEIKGIKQLVNYLNSSKDESRAGDPQINIYLEQVNKKTLLISQYQQAFRETEQEIQAIKERFSDDSFGSGEYIAYYEPDVA